MDSETRDRLQSNLTKDDPSLPARKTYLFVVGIDQYQYLNPLNNARRDAETVAQALTEYFDCDIPDFAPPIYDQEATRGNINKRFRALAREFRKKEYQHNLIIYFAGHGEWDEDFEAGYWALHGAKGQDLSSYYSNADLVTAIKAIRSHHTLIISDSCFSGGLIDTNPRRSNRKESQRSRYVLASGLKDETVSDGLAGTHSPFAQTILNFLEEKRGKEFRLAELESYVEDLFSQRQLKQEPIFAPLNVPDNQYGQLWLRPRFDVVQELQRLVEVADIIRLDSFIRAKDEELSRRGKLLYARNQLEELAWQQALQKDDGESYLRYLDKFLHAENDHPERALERLGKWVAQEKKSRKRAEEKLALWQSRYEGLKAKQKEGNQASKALKQAEGKIKELEQEDEKSKAERAKQEETLQRYQAALQDLARESDQAKSDLKQQNEVHQKAKTEWQKEKKSLNERIQELEQRLASQPKVKQPPKPSFDFPVPEMIRIEGGTFQMGSNESSDEKPMHEVRLDTFELGKYPITQAEWKAIMGGNPSKFRGNDRPVEQVSWDDCQEFIERLNQKTRLNFRLPTEAEWEYAAGGGSQNRTAYAGTDSESMLGAYAWYRPNSTGETHPVGQKRPNALGLYDMSGNVYEWCQDWYGEYPSGPQTNPTGPSDGSSRVRRGGSGHEDAGYCRVAYRYLSGPGFRRSYLGFRLARSISF